MKLTPEVKARLDEFGRSSAFSHLRPRHDSDLSIFVENELQQVVAETFDQLYPQLRARDYIPIPGGVNPGAQAWAYDSIERRGQAEFMGSSATDFPRADVAKRRFSFPIHSINLGYGYSVEELMSARFTGQALDRERAFATRRGIAEKEHEILLYGDEARQLPGFLTNPSTPIVVVPNGDWLNPATTSDEILADMHAIVDAVYLQTKEVHEPDTMLMDTARYRLIQTKRIPDTSMSIMEYFMSKQDFITAVRPLRELSTASPVDFGNAPAIMCYERSPRNVRGIVPMAFEQLSPQMRGFETIVPAWSRQGGTVWTYPMAGVMGVGI